MLFLYADLSLNILGTGVNFQIGVIIEIGFGVISSSMTALNHILVKTVPRFIDSRLSGTVVRKWFGSGTSTPATRSFHEAFSSKPQGPRDVESFGDDHTLNDGDFGGEGDFGWEMEGREAAHHSWEKHEHKTKDKELFGMDNTTALYFLCQ